MSDENIPSAPPGEEPAPNEDENSAAAAEPAGEWQMPKPVFRQTSGYLPKGFPKKFHEEDTLEPHADPTAEEEITGETAATTAPPEAAAPAVVLEQPSLSEEFLLDDIDESPPETIKRTGVLRIIFIILGILAMLAFVVAFLVVVYLLFFFQTSESQNLN